MKDRKNSLIVAIAAIALGTSISTFAFATTSAECAMDLQGWGNYYVCKKVKNINTWVNIDKSTTSSGDTALSAGKKCNKNSPVSENGKSAAGGSLSNPIIFSSKTTWYSWGTNGNACFAKNEFGDWEKI